MLICYSLSLKLGSFSLWEPLSASDSLYQFWWCLLNIHYKTTFKPPRSVYAHCKRKIGKCEGYACPKSKICWTSKWRVSNDKLKYFYCRIFWCIEISVLSPTLLNNKNCRIFLPVDHIKAMFFQCCCNGAQWVVLPPSSWQKVLLWSLDWNYKMQTRPI